MKRYKAGSDEEIASEETERETKDSLQEKSLSDEDSATPLAEEESQDVAENSVAQEEAEQTSTPAMQDDKDEQSHMLAVQDDEVEDISDVADEEEVRDQPQRRSFSWPTREQVFAWAPFIGVVLLGAILRFWGLGDKPLHHDESLHAYFSLQLMHNMENWVACFNQSMICYRYDPLLHGPFQFHAIALVYKISQLLGAPDHGVNTTTVRIAAATLGTLIVGLPYFLRDYLGRVGAWLACFLLAVSPSMVYYSRFAREDIYMACFTLLLVVGVARYLRSRKIGALILAAVAFALSYATKEATFLTIGIFGSFFGALIVWELGLRWPWRSRVASDAAFVRYIPKTMAPLAVFLYFLILAPFAKVFFGWIKDLSIFVTNPQNTAIADQFVAHLKMVTVVLVPWVGIALGVLVLGILARELGLFGELPPPGRHGFAARIDPKKQPLLDVIVTMSWTHWFFALICGWIVFLVLFTVLFTNIGGGIGDGIWQGLYYWIQQQQVARGGQPWYYYLLLIPLYEQIGVVFGLIGIVRCLRRPTAFRLFLVWWFVGNFFIYSWAGEKMPWLTIHMTMPLMLLAAIGLEPVAMTLVDLVKGWLGRPAASSTSLAEAQPVEVLQPRPGSRRGVFAISRAILGGVLAVLLLAPTLQNMYQLSYVHAADGPHEMMIYVQTTTDVNIVMAKVAALDQKLTGGKHVLSIGVMNDADWPFHWYLRDYTNVCFDYPTACNGLSPDVIISGGDNLGTAQAQYALSTSVGKAPQYLYHQYHMRSWWDEGYKPPPCVPSKTNTCQGQPTWGGVGPLLWLSYGDNPPPGATFNLGLAARNIWQWWWQRKAIGGTDGSYDMGLFIRTQDASLTGVTP